MTLSKAKGLYRAGLSVLFEHVLIEQDEEDAWVWRIERGVASSVVWPWAWCGFGCLA